MRTWLSVVALLTSGCIVPRSMIQGQMAAPVGRGAADVAVFAGLQYGEQINPRYDGYNPVTDEPLNTEEKTTALSVPNFEANLQYGFTDNVAINVHGSSAGFQPGVKITLNDAKDDAHFALLPQVAFGYASMGQATNLYGGNGVRQDGAPSTGTSFTFLGGLRLMVSHKSGFYAGAGYDFLFNRNFNKTRIGQGNASVEQDTIYSTTAHQVALNLGFSIQLGFIHIRPEVAVAFYPGINQNRSVNTAGSDTVSANATGGFGWAIFPGFAIAVQSPKRALTEEERDEEAEKKKAEQRRLKHRRNRGLAVEEDDDEDDDDDERPAPKKRPARDDDDDRPAPKKKNIDEWD